LCPQIEIAFDATLAPSPVPKLTLFLWRYTVKYDEEFDADDVLRDIDSGDDLFLGDVTMDDDMRELNFGNLFEENANFSDMVSDLDSTEDMWD